MNMPKGTWIFLRGLGRESGHWSGFLEKFQERFPHTNPIALDLPGTGRWNKKPSPSSVKDIVHFIREHNAELLKSPFSLVGISLGGMVALEWASHYPKELRQVVVINTSAKNIGKMTDRLSLTALKSFAKVAIAKSPEKQEEEILSLVAPHLQERSTIYKLWVEIAKKKPVAKKVIANQLLAASTFSLPKSLSVPLLVLASEKDALASSQSSKEIAKRLGAAIQVHPSAGHDLPLEAPNWVLDQISKL